MILAQCRTVKISILGDEGVPVQVDGEAWIQPPGYIRIIHKNRAQTLTRDRVRAAARRALRQGYQTHLWAHLCTLEEPGSFTFCARIFDTKMNLTRTFPPLQCKKISPLPFLVTVDVLVAFVLVRRVLPT